MSWQPIESAPENRVVLVFAPWESPVNVVAIRWGDEWSVADCFARRAIDPAPHSWMELPDCPESYDPECPKFKAQWAEWKQRHDAGHPKRSCVTCDWHRKGAVFDQCAHPSASKDLVSGSTGFCNTNRIFGKCGKNGAFWTPHQPRPVPPSLWERLKRFVRFRNPPEDFSMDMQARVGITPYGMARLLQKLKQGRYGGRR